MNQKQALWEGIRSYNFEDLVPPRLRERLVELLGGTNATTRAFAAKLAKKLDWELDFALRSIVEYKKFVYLGLVSPNEVTPSTVIDKVWHEHQLFTAGYRNFCANVLGRHFAHAPELISIDEQTGVFNAQYYDTLERYRSEFGMEPPADIWGRKKFNSKEVPSANFQPKKKRGSDEDSAIYNDSTPLSAFYSSPNDGGLHHTHPQGFDGFGGGRSGGAGSEDSWGGVHSDPSPSDVGTAHSCGSHSCSANSCSASSCGGGCGGGGGD